MRQFRNRLESIAEFKILFLIFKKLSILSGLGLVDTGKTDLGHLGCYCKSVVNIKVWKISAVTLCTSCSTTLADPILSKNSNDCIGDIFCVSSEPML